MIRPDDTNQDIKTKGNGYLLAVGGTLAAWHAGAGDYAPFVGVVVTVGYLGYRVVVMRRSQEAPK